MPFRLFLCYLCIRNQNKSVIMKVKVSKEQIQKILDDPQAAQNAKISVSDPWWVIALKVAAYLIGLILAGAATTSCASVIGIV